MQSPFIPPVIKFLSKSLQEGDNFDAKYTNADWKDANEEMMRNNSMMLRRNSVQALFNGYYHDTEIEKSNDLNSVGNEPKETKQKHFVDKEDMSSTYQQESTFNNMHQQTGPAQTIPIR